MAFETLNSTLQPKKKLFDQHKRKAMKNACQKSIPLYQRDFISLVERKKNIKEN